MNRRAGARGGSSPPVCAEAEAERRTATLENALGDPTHPAHPLAYRRIVESDERGRLPEDAMGILDDFGLGAEVVPRELGGRFDRTDVLARVLRPVSRRDAALAWGRGCGSFAAGVHIWHAGTAQQKRAAADTLLRGAHLAVAGPAFAHANRFTSNGIHIDTVPGGHGGPLLRGHKAMLLGAGQADGLVVFGRTSSSGAQCSAVLVDTAELSTDALRLLPRPSATGLRALTTSGVEFRNCHVPDSAQLGEPDEGVPLALRSFPLTHAVIPSIALGTADTTLRAAVRFALADDQLERTGPRGRRVRSLLGGAFLDLLICDCLALVSTRAAHLLPGQAGLYGAAAAYVLPRILGETVHDLSVVLGGRAFDRTGVHGIFQKNVRDLPALGSGHAGSAICQTIVVTQLPLLARHAWSGVEEPPAALFRPREDLPPLQSELLFPAGPVDGLSAVLTAGAEGSLPAELRAVVRDLANELRSVHASCLRRPPPAADPHSFALCDRYMLLLAASAVVGVWVHGQFGPDHFLADPVWATAALARIGHRLGWPARTLRPSHQEQVDREVLARFDQARSYDLYDMALAG